MHDQRTLTPAQQDDQIDMAILGLLYDSPGPWAVDEVIRAMGDPVAAQDGLSRLTRSGLAHRLDGFVFASRSAARACALHA